MRLFRTFEVIYFAGFIIGCLIRMIHTRTFSRHNPEIPVPHPRDRLWMGVASFGYIIPLVYLAFSWLDFADYPLVPWTGWLGTGLFASALIMLWRSHVDLDRNWSPWAESKKNHTLVTTGIYSRIRHPMYAAHWLWAVAQLFLLQNWIAGPAMIVCLLPLYLYRVEKEEQEMMRLYGVKYHEYMARTCRLLPCLFPKSGSLK